MRRILHTLFVLFLVTPTIAREQRVEHRMVVDIPFVLAGGRESDIRYDLDSIALVKSLRNLELLNADHTSVITNVEFYSSVSPEGTIRFNKQLGKIRLATAERIVRQHLQISDSVRVKRNERYIPWHDYLLPAIQADSTIPYRNELLKLIYRPTDAKGKDNRRVELKRAMNGKLWEVVQDNYFDHIRKGGAIITIERTAFDDIAPTAPNQLIALREEVEVNPQALSLPASTNEPSATSKKKPHYALSVKTNVLGWGLAIINAAVEFDFAKHWSVNVPIYYSAYNYFTPTIKFRTLGIQPEVRYWLKEDNTGFFAGAHLCVASYNIAVDGDIRYQDHAGKRPALGGGLSIGYKLPMSKKHPNWLVEFTVGAGVYSLYYDTFYNVDNGRLIGTHKKTYWGIDNAGVNISYRFDLNKRKRCKE